MTSFPQSLSRLNKKFIHWSAMNLISIRQFSFRRFCSFQKRPWAPPWYKHMNTCSFVCIVHLSPRLCQRAGKTFYKKWAQKAPARVSFRAGAFGFSLLFHRVGDAADLLHPALHHIAGFQKAGGIHPHAHAGGGAGDDDAAGQQGHPLAQFGDHHVRLDFL